MGRIPAWTNGEIDALCSEIGLQALPQVFHKHYPARRRAVWLVVLVLGLLASVFFTTRLIQDYSQHESSTRISMDPVGPQGMVFPAVTFWNMNPIRSSFAQGALYEEVCAARGGLNEQMVYSPKGMPENFTDEIMLDAAHRLEDMLLECTFNGEPCSVANFSKLVSPYPYANWGVAYTFNPHSLVRTNRKGPAGGLHMVLDIQLEDYCPRTEEAGVRLLLHDHRDLDEEEAREHNHPLLGSSHGPGKRYTFNVHHVEDHFPGEPYGLPCIDVKKGDEYPTYRKAWNCISEKCLNVTAAGISVFNLPFNEDPCVAKCFNRGEHRFCDGVRFPYEIGETSLTIFDPMENLGRPIGVSKINSNSTIGRLLQEAVGNSTEEKMKQVREHLAKSIMVIDVHYKDMVREIRIVVPSNTFWSLVAEIGGLLGLFLGASIATFFEISEVACILCCMARHGQNDYLHSTSIYSKYALKSPESTSG